MLALLTTIFVSAAVLFVAIAAPADDEPDPWIEKGFVIIRSTTDYNEAVRIAEIGSRSLKVPVDLRGLIHDPDHGLTWPREQCAKDPLYPYPCYFARGRFDSGVYLSVERSDAYETFQPGYFIVIFATGDPGSPELTDALELARSRFQDAYLKTDRVYHGCMH